MQAPMNVKYLVRVLRPFGRYIEILTDHEISDTNFSDLIVAYQAAALVAYHFPEAENCLGSLASDTIALRRKLADVVDTGKHGELKKTERIVTLTSAFVFEVDAQKRISMLGTAINGSSENLGKFDADQLLRDYLNALSRDLNVRPPPQIVRQLGPFVRLLMLTASGSPEIASVDFKSVIRVEENLVPVAVPLRFELVVTPNGGLVFSITCDEELIEADPDKPMTPIDGCRVHAYAIMDVVQRRSLDAGI